jgi:hypothetical protein
MEAAFTPTLSTSEDPRSGALGPFGENSHVVLMAMAPLPLSGQEEGQSGHITEPASPTELDQEQPAVDLDHVPCAQESPGRAPSVEALCPVQSRAEGGEGEQRRY